MVHHIPSPLQREFKYRLTISNPVFEENERMGRWNGNTPRFFHCYEEMPSRLTVPRGSGQLIGEGFDGKGLFNSVSNNSHSI